jgi:hypothetical protein
MSALVVAMLLVAIAVSLLGLVVVGQQNQLDQLRGLLVAEQRRRAIRQTQHQTEGQLDELTTSAMSQMVATACASHKNLL